MNLKKLAISLNAKDITNQNLDKISHIKKAEIIYRNFGKYGLNGVIFSDKKGKFYFISKRNSNLFYFA